MPAEQDQVARIIKAWQIDAKTREKAGHYHGSQETFAWLVVHGGGHIMGHWVPVHFDWPNEQFAEKCRRYCERILELAKQADREVPS
jgi:hypothetical protein